MIFSGASAVCRDNLMVWRLDRLGRSLPHLVSIVAELKARGVQCESPMEAGYRQRGVRTAGAWLAMQANYDLWCAVQHEQPPVRRLQDAA